MVYAVGSGTMAPANKILGKYYICSLSTRKCQWCI